MFTLTVDATKKCNLNCSYCYKGESCDESIDFDRFVAAFEKVWPTVVEMSGDPKVFCLGFMGGEPTCQFDMVQKIVEFAVAKCERNGVTLKWGMTSNLTLLDEQKVLFVKQTGGQIHSSIDGDEFSQNVNRPTASGSGSFEEVMKGINNLKKFDMLLGARMTFTPVTLPYLVENLKFVNSLGYKYIAAFPSTGHIPWEPYLDEVREIARKIGVERMHDLKGIDRLRPWDDCAYHNTHGLKINNSHCGACRSAMAIGVDGCFYPCHRFTDMHNKEKFKIGDHDNFKSTYSAMRVEFEKSFSASCVDCEVYPICRGGCWAENLNASGSLQGINSDLCGFNKSFMEGVREAQIVFPKSMRPPSLSMKGEGSCVTTDTCIVCDCSSCSSCDSCESCWYSECSGCVGGPEYEIRPD